MNWIVIIIGLILTSIKPLIEWIFDFKKGINPLLSIVINIVLVIIGALLVGTGWNWDKIFNIKIIIDRPYVTIMGIGLTNVTLDTGIIIIRSNIKNSGKIPAKITNSNITLWFENDISKLPDTPTYVPSFHNINGIIINPGEVCNARFTTEKHLTKNDIESINKSVTKLYLYGFVKYSDENNRTWNKGFIGKYQPLNDPRFGMFDEVVGDYPKYSYDK